MAGTMYSFGPLTFTATKAAPDKVDHHETYRWALLSRLSRRPALQWLGIGEETMTFEGVIHPTFDYTGQGSYVGIRRVDEMRQLAEQGLPQDLYDGFGNYYGKWCCKSVKEVREQMFDNSGPRKQTFIMELSRYGDDNQADQPIIYGPGANDAISTPRTDTVSNPNIANLA